VSKYEYVDSQTQRALQHGPGVKDVSLVGRVNIGFLPLAQPPAVCDRRTQGGVDSPCSAIFFAASDGTYGYRRIHADVVDEGSECSPELVRHIMRDEGLWPANRDHLGSLPNRMVKGQ